MLRCAAKYTTFRSIFDAPKLREKLSEIEKQTADPTLWSNPEKSQQVMRENKRLENALATEAELARRSAISMPTSNWHSEGEDVSADLRREVDALRKLVEKLETETLLSGRTTNATRSLPSIPAPAAPSRRTGPRC